MEQNAGISNADVNPTVNKLDLEVKELELKVKELLFKVKDLERPTYKKMSFWTNIITVIIAIIGIAGQSIYSNIKSERAELRLDEATKKTEEAEAKMLIAIAKRDSARKDMAMTAKRIKDSVATLNRMKDTAQKQTAQAQAGLKEAQRKLDIALKAYNDVSKNVAYSSDQSASSKRANVAVADNNNKLEDILFTNTSGTLLKSSILKIYYLPAQKEKAQQLDNVLKTNGASSQYLPPAYTISNVKRNEIVYYNDPQLIYCKAVQQLLQQQGLGDFAIRKSSGANATIDYFKIYLVK